METFVVADVTHREDKAVLSPSSLLSENMTKKDDNKDKVNREKLDNNPAYPPPPDKYKIVYLIFVLHGVGTLMPWNMFINAKDYFEKFKLDPTYSTTTPVNDLIWYSAYFFTILFWAAQLPNLVFNWVNVVFPCGESVKKRVIISLTVEVFVCVLTMILAYANTSDQPKLFFWLTMLSVITINVAGGFYQNSIYGIGAKIGYTGALVLGSNLSGVFTSATSLMILAMESSQMKSAVFYFGTSALSIILCLVSYLRLPSFKFYRYHQDKLHGQVELQEDQSHCKSPMDKSEKRRTSCNLYLLKKCWVQCFNVFMVYFVTLAIFPAVHANVKVFSYSDFVINNEQYFVGVTCFLTFNLTALLGNLLAGCVQWPKPNRLWIAVTLRLLLIPFFLLCNYHPIGFTRSINTVWFGDWSYWIGGVVLGLTNGYFSSLAMMYCPRMVKCEEATTAGMLGAAFLVTGVFFGVNFSAIMPYIVASKNH